MFVYCSETNSTVMFDFGKVGARLDSQYWMVCLCASIDSSRFDVFDCGPGPPGWPCPSDNDVGRGREQASGSSDLGGCETMCGQSNIVIQSIVSSHSCTQESLDLNGTHNVVPT